MLALEDVTFGYPGGTPYSFAMTAQAGEVNDVGFGDGSALGFKLLAHLHIIEIICRGRKGH